MSVALVIPARLASTRFHAKPLTLVGGRPLVREVVLRGTTAGVDRVILATDDAAIAAAVEGTGCEVFISRGDHPCGTDRIAEVAREIDADYIINLQGDQLVPGPEFVEDLVSRIDERLKIATMFGPIEDDADLDDRNVVKVVVDDTGDVVYMSRFGIPFNRGGGPEPQRFKQIGIYVFERRALLEFASMAPTSLEASEGVELLRAIQHGVRVQGIRTDSELQDVDVPEDVEGAERYIKAYPSPRAD